MANWLLSRTKDSRYVEKVGTYVAGRVLITKIKVNLRVRDGAPSANACMHQPRFDYEEQPKINVAPGGQLLRSVDRFCGGDSAIEICRSRCAPRARPEHVYACGSSVAGRRIVFVLLHYSTWATATTPRQASADLHAYYYSLSKQTHLGDA